MASPSELLVAMTMVDVDPVLLERACGLTGERSHRAVLDLALRLLIAAKNKGAMIDGIAGLTELEAEPTAPTEPAPTTPGA